MKEMFRIQEVIGEFMHRSQNVEEMLKLIYVLKVWQKLTKEIILIDESLTFESFFNQKIELNKLESIFSELAKSQKLFTLYHFQSRYFQLNEIENIITFIANNKLPSITLTFFDEKLRSQRGEVSISHQISELGLKLLGDIQTELYVPFTNGFTYTNYTNKIIYAENNFTDNEFIAEIIRILEDKEIHFVLTDPLKHPSYTQEVAPHILKQFDSVISFPPFGMRGKVNTAEDKFHRFQFQRGTVLDIAYFEHILAQTKSKAVVLMPVGFTYRGSSEEGFRKYLTEKNYLDTIIQLPPNLHSATSIETTFFVINKQKKDNKVHFINLKDEAFIARVGRKLVLKSLDEILDIYENRKVLENVSTLVTNDEIASNNYSFAIDRYIISSEAKELQKTLEKFELLNLEDIADIRRSQLFKDEEEGQEVYEISPSDFSKAGFTFECGKTKQIGSQYKKLQTYSLEPFDVLLSTKGTIGKVAIVGEITDVMIASQAIQVIRIQDTDKQNKAVVLYMFFKSELGQTILSSLVAGVAMPQIATAEIKKIGIPVLPNEQKKQTVLNFNSEMEMYNEINKINTNIKQIHTNFLGNNQ